MNQQQETSFPERSQIVDKSYINDIVEQAKQINLDNAKYEDTSQFKPRTKIVEEQKEYFWIRLYLNNEIELTPNTDITIQYLLSGEKLNTKFICYDKTGSNKNSEGEVVNYIADDNKKILCLMIDAEKINKHNEDIPFLKTLFRIGRYYEAQILRINDLLIEDQNGNKLEFFDIDF
jgi:hypothetical protein